MKGLESGPVPGWLEPLRAGLADPTLAGQVVALRPGRGGRPAAVLVLLGEGASGPQVLLVERAATLRTHAGQIAFPGGASDPVDADLAATALREAREEVGLEPTGVTVLGALPPAHVAVSGFDVTAVVGWWREPTPTAVLDSREVASVLLVPVTELVDPAHRAQVRHPSGYRGPGFEVAGHLVWGLTAHLLDGVLELAGWARPWDRGRRVEIPDRYLRDTAATGRAAPPHLGDHDAH